MRKGNTGGKGECSGGGQAEAAKKIWAVCGTCIEFRRRARRFWGDALEKFAVE